MMKRMFGLLAGAWARDGELSAGTINAVMAPETSMLLVVRLLIDMTPGPPLQSLVAFFSRLFLAMPEGASVMV
jgi:hypothetical protein